MGKGNNTKSFAEEGLEQINEEVVAASAALASNGHEDEEGDLQQVGGNEPLAFFYRTSAPKKPTKSPYKVIAKGDVIEGRYERSFTGGKFGNTTYVIRLGDGSLIGLPSAGSLTKAMGKLAEGSKVKIEYNGMSTIKGGQWEGTDAHNFTVFGNKLKQ